MEIAYITNDNVKTSGKNEATYYNSNNPLKHGASEKNICTWNNYENTLTFSAYLGHAINDIFDRLFFIKNNFNVNIDVTIIGSAWGNGNEPFALPAFEKITIPANGRLTITPYDISDYALSQKNSSNNVVQVPQLNHPYPYIVLKFDVKSAPTAGTLLVVDSKRG